VLAVSIAQKEKGNRDAQTGFPFIIVLPKTVRRVSKLKVSGLKF